MKSPDDLYLKARESTDLHEDLISSYSGKISEEFSKLIKAVFSYMPIVYHPAAKTDSRISLLSRYFYNSCYQPHALIRGTTGRSVILEDFLTEVLSASYDPKRNRLFYLLGGVGVGKTCFVNWILSTQIKKHVEDGKLWFLKIDLEQLTQGKEASFEEVISKMAGKALKILEEVGYSKDPRVTIVQEKLDHVVHAPQAPGNSTAVATALINLCQLLYRIGKGRLFIVIDNIDYICHKNDRGLFWDDDSSQEYDTLRSVVELISNFGRSQSLSNLGATVLLITRSDSFKLLSQLHQYSLPDADHGLNTFTLVPADWKDVLLSRKKLIEYAAQKEPPGKKEDLLSIMETINDHLDDKSVAYKSLSEDLIRLSNKGLRDVVDFFAQYAWMPKEMTAYQEGILERFVHQWPVGMIAYLLNQRCLFSQEHSRFPNIYLHNILPDTDHLFNKRHEVHNVYWLNIMILKFLEQETYYTPQQMMQIFTPTKGQRYDPQLVKHYFGVLSTFIECYCIVAERGWNDERKDFRINRVGLTDRAKHFLKSSMYEKFFYLQLIVDDFALPLPNSIINHFKYDHISYGYIVENEDEYTKKAKVMIARKAMQVLLFTYVMEISLELERAKYNTVFERLVNTENVKLPNIGQARRNLLQEFRSLNKILGDFMKIEDMENRAAGFQSPIRKDLEGAYGK